MTFVNIYREHLNNTFSKLLKQIFLFLGPVYIKIGQLLSCDYPLFNELYTLQNDCPSLTKKQINYFQNKYIDLNISDTPIATGSISVVHLGHYKGNKVAIKIKRPNIDVSIERSIWYANIFRIIINYIPYFKILNLDNKIKTTMGIYKEQTNFKNELYNLTRYKEITNNITNLKSPHYFQEKSNDEIIVMQYLPGKNIITNKIYDDKIKRQIGHCIMGQYFSGIMNGIVHGDLHCGNLAYDDKNNVIVYDFGIVFYLTNYEKNGILEIINHLCMKNSEKTIKSFMKYFIEGDSLISNFDIHKIQNIIDNEQLNIFKIFIEIKNLLEKKKMVFNDKLISFEISLLSLNNTIHNLNVGHDADFLIKDLLESINNSIIEN